MRNTYLHHADMLYTRVKPSDDDLVEIEFEDMEPIDMLDLVGVAPHQAIALMYAEDFDVVGVGSQAAVATMPADPIQRVGPAKTDLRPDELPTEEFTVHDEPSHALLGL